MSTLLSALRTARRLQAWLLLLFVCSIGAAVASPVLQAGPGEPWAQLCSAGVDLKAAAAPGDEGSVPPAFHKLDCPLCLPMGAAAPTETAVATLGPVASAVRAGRPDTLRISPNALRPPARAPPL